MYWRVVFAVVLFAAVAGYTALALAENSKLILPFGGAPGEPLAHSYDYGQPDDAGERYTVRIPAIHKDVQAVFYDTQLTIRTEGKIVERVDAQRAFKSLGDCNEGLAAIKQRLNAGLPTDSADGSWLYQSPDGKTRGRATCDKGSRRLFFVLTLEIVEASR